jgi:8-oxo-dGTP pyrophosphatase MutT (NUDIX family)
MKTLATSPDDRHFTASMMVLDHRLGRVLLVHHKKMDLWVFPGGHVDPNEAPHETAVREVLEETGVDVRLAPGASFEKKLGFGVALPAPIEIAEHPAPAWAASGKWPAEPTHWHLDFLYLGFASSLLPVKRQEEEVHGAKWFSFAQVKLLDAAGTARKDVLIIARRYLG